MTLAELRDTLASVSDAVQVPLPDAKAFERRVAGVRRRRGAVRVAAAAAAVAVVASGTTLALSRDTHPTQRTGLLDEVPASPHWVPVVLGGHLNLVDGAIIGPSGPAVASIVGTIPQGVVVLTDDGTLSRRDGADELAPLVPDRVRRAYLDGDRVVYEDRGGLIHVWGNDSGLTEQGQLMAAGSGRFVTADSGSAALVLHGPDGTHELRFDDPPSVIHQVEVGGDLVAVRTDDQLVFFDLTGRQVEERGGGRMVGALAPDGHTYAQASPDGMGVQLVDPASGDAQIVEGPRKFIPASSRDGSVFDVGWAPDGDLLVVMDSSSSHVLWRCAPDGSGCFIYASDPSETLWLGGVPL